MSKRPRSQEGEGSDDDDGITTTGAAQPPRKKTETIVISSDSEALPEAQEPVLKQRFPDSVLAKLDTWWFDESDESESDMMSQDIEEPEPDEYIEGMRNLSNLRRVSGLMEHIRNTNNIATIFDVPNVEKAPTNQPVADVLDALFEVPAIEGRACRVSSTSKNNRAWLIHIEDLGSQPLFDKRRTFRLPWDFVDQNQKPVASAIGDELCKILNRWPIRYPTNSVGLGRSMLHAARLRIDPQARKLLPSPRANATKSPYEKIKYCVTIPYIDRVTGLTERIPVDVMPGSVGYATIPEVPQYCEFVHFTGGHKIDIVPANLAEDGTRSWDSIVPADFANKSRHPKEAHENAVRLCRFIAWRMTNMISTSADMHNIANTWMRTVGAHRQTSKNIYGERRLFLIQPKSAERVIDVNITKAVKQIVPGTWGAIRIRGTLDASWLLPVIDAITYTYVTQGDVTQAWIEGARVADDVNAQILDRLLPPSVCQCSEEQSQTELHPCGRCLSATVCASRQDSLFGTQICSFCYDEEVKLKGSGLVDKISTRALRNLLRAECQRTGKKWDDPHVQTKFCATVKELRDSIPTDGDGLVYYDGYRQDYVSIRDDNAQIFENGHPQIPSVEGIFPYSDYISADGLEIGYHCQGNIMLTAAAYNKLKGVAIPAFLADLQWYVLRTEQDGNHSEADKREMMRLSNLRFEVRSKTPYRQRTRIRQLPDLDKQRVQQDKDEWIAGAPVDDPNSPKKDFYQFSKQKLPAGVTCPWDTQPEIRERLDSIVREIEAITGITLERADDGAPWIWLDEMPPDWSWAGWFRLCSERLRRMEIACNRYWATVDTIETLFLEFIYQHCNATNPRYREFLDLPMSPYAGHHLGVSVAHRVHKRAMLTGWSPNPSKLSDRKDEKNNILIETKSSNWYKGEYSERHYPLLREMTGKLNVSEKYFDPKRTAVGVPDSNVRYDVNLDLDPNMLDDIDPDFVVALDENVVREMSDFDTEVELGAAATRQDQDEDDGEDDDDAGSGSGSGKMPEALFTAVWGSGVSRSGTRGSGGRGALGGGFAGGGSAGRGSAQPPGAPAESGSTGPTGGSGSSAGTRGAHGRGGRRARSGGFVGQGIRGRGTRGRGSGA